MCTVFIFLLLFAGSMAVSSSRFTNIECEVLDSSFVHFKQCNLKVLGRGIVGLNMHAAVQQLPVEISKINLSLFKKFSGFRPFMYNITFDICKLLERRNVQLSFERIFFDSLLENSNINHSCPYNHDLIANNWVFKDQYFKFLPLPNGKYKFRLKVSANNDWRGIIQLYLYVFRQEDA